MTGAGPGRCPLFVELCCGSAAVTLRLIGGDGCRPPVSYMGNKQSYAWAILRVLGLRAGQGAAAVLLADAGPWAKVWRALFDPQCAPAVLDRLRSWRSEDARALWTRLRDEGPPELPAEFAAWWTFLTLGSYQCKGPDAGIGYPEARRDLKSFGQIRPALDRLADWTARWLWVQARTCNSTPVFVEGGDWRMCEKRSSARRHVTGATAADYAKVARQRGSKRDAQGAPGMQDAGTPARRLALVRERAAGTAITVVHGDVADLDPPDDLPAGTRVYLDAPYQGCTGYGADLDRAGVLDVARRWADAGAVVAVSEREPLPLPGWRHVEITGCRRGKRRTFGVTPEWLTVSAEPAWTPPVQAELFAGAPA